MNKLSPPYRKTLSFLRRFLRKKHHRGILLIEVLLASGVLGVIFVATMSALGISFDGVRSFARQNKAMFLLEEELEPLLTIRDIGWSNLTNGTYYVSPQGANWILVPTSTGETIDEFTRNVTIASVYRDTNGQIVATGGTLDPSTKKVTATVSWQTLLPHQLALTTYLTRYKENAIWTDTTEAQFTQGTHTGTTVTNTEGGEVELGAGGHGNWCKPNLSITAVDLPKQGVANAVTAIKGQVFAGTGDNASGPSFANVLISDTDPPQGTIDGTFEGQGPKIKTNGVFGETQYAYLATDNNFKEIVIINLTQKDANNKYQEAGYFDPSPKGNGNSIFVSGTIGFMTEGNTLYTFDVSSKTGSRPQLGSVTLAGTGNRVFVIGSYAYVATSSTTKQLQVFSVSPDGRTLTLVGERGVSGQGGKDIFVNGTGTRAYLATGVSLTQREFFIIDVTTKATPGNPPVTFPLFGSYNTQGDMDPKGVTVVTGNKAILVGIGGIEYQVINITNEGADPLPNCGNGLNIDSGVNGVASILEDDGDAYSYIITRDASSELKIIEGGPGGQYSASGIFESRTFDAGTSTAFNRFTTLFDKPTQTDIAFKIAVADADPITGCTGVPFTFVDPSPNNVIPLDDDGSGYENPGQCFRYQALLTTSDSTQSPIFKEFIVNYSP